MSRNTQVSVVSTALPPGGPPDPATVFGRIAFLSILIPHGVPAKPLAGAATFLKGCPPEGTARLNSLYTTTLTGSAGSANGYLMWAEGDPDFTPSALERR
jgi:hypothetical protein